MKKKLFFFSLKHPLLYILVFAIIARILAVLFTGGWLIGLINNGFNYYTIPSSWLATPWIVYCTRFILGAFSLLIITLAYRITKLIADKTTALEIATFGALLWGVPYVSVHPFASVVSLPFLLYGTLLILKQHKLLEDNEIEKFHRTTFIVAGFFLGLGFAVYYHSLIYYIGIILTLLILKNWKGALMTLIGYIIAVGITQTVIDLVVYHRPFVAMTEFFDNILINYETLLEYIDFEFTLGFVLLLLVPPMSFMILFGLFRVFRKYILLVLPALLLMLHSMFLVDNINVLLMMTPTYMIAGYVGWKEFYKNSGFWTRNKWLLWTCYALFALLNTALLICSYIYF